MKNTKIKLLCFLFALLLSADAFSQLRPVTRSGGNNGDCLEVYSTSHTVCTEFTLPVDNLTFDETNPDENGCFPVNNFGCDLHIGLTLTQTGETSYVKITSCIVEDIIFATENDPAEAYPTICIQVPGIGKSGDCEIDRYSFNIDLFCRDENGEFTSITDMAMDDPENDWASIFPNQNDFDDNVLGKDYWSVCCDALINHQTPGFELSDPLIGQNDDGSKVIIRNFQDLTEAAISVFDSNNQKINETFTIIEISENEYSINTSSLTQGIYVIRVSDNESVYSKTILRM